MEKYPLSKRNSTFGREDQNQEVLLNKRGQTPTTLRRQCLSYLNGSHCFPAIGLIRKKKKWGAKCTIAENPLEKYISKLQSKKIGWLVSQRIFSSYYQRLLSEAWVLSSEKLDHGRPASGTREINPYPLGWCFPFLWKQEGGEWLDTYSSVWWISQYNPDRVSLQVLFYSEVL